MLQVQGLTVEVGGKTVVQDASFVVAARDKIGIVGRNGAGKTSLFKVLGGAAQPTFGSIVRKGEFGYLPQDPKIPGSRETLSAISHVLSGRQIDEQLTRIEKLRIHMEESATAAKGSATLGQYRLAWVAGGLITLALLMYLARRRA